jgi:hypothetical protein
MYATSGVTGLPQVYELNVPQTGGRQYLFDEIEINNGTINESAWYIVAIPQILLGNTTNRMTEIEYGTSNSYGTTYNTNSTLYEWSIDYSGSKFANTTYRLYSTWGDPGMQINNTSNDIFFRGGAVE